jgi:uncharacterized protein
MRLDITKIREPYVRIDRTDEPSAFEREDAYSIVAPVGLQADLHKDREKVRLVGTVATTLELGCSRCTEGFTVPVHAAFDLLYLPAASAETEAEHEVQEDDLNTSYYREGVIDLADLVREQLYLSLPMKPLCQEGCRGLCPECGINLNHASCDCAPAWEDPRLAPLKALSRNKTDA